MKFWTRADTVFMVIVLTLLFGGLALNDYWKAEDQKHRTLLYQAWQKCEQSPLTEQEFWVLKRAGLIEAVHSKCTRKDCAAVEKH